MTQEDWMAMSMNEIANVCQYMTLNELKTECKNYKLPHSGNKSKLSKALKSHLHQLRTKKDLEGMEIIIKEGRDKRKAEELEKELDNFEEDFLQASVNTLEADLEDNEDAQLSSFGSGKRRKGRNIFSDSSSDEV